MFHCPGCKQPRDNAGSGMRMFFQTPTLVCVGCQERMRHVKPKPRKLIGSTGKAQRQPEGSQRTFTMNGAAVIPTVVKSYAGFDVRYSIDPATFKGGAFVAEWKRLRGKA